MFRSLCSLRRWGPFLALSFALPIATTLAQDSAGEGDCDLDGDGYPALVCDPEGDCNDDDPSVYPGATEIADDERDQDCDGLDLVHVLVPGGGAQLAGGAGTCGVASSGAALAPLFAFALVILRRRPCVSP